MKILLWLMLCTAPATAGDMANTYDYYNYNAFSSVAVVVVSSIPVVLTGSDGSTVLATLQACRLSNGRIIHRIVFPTPRYMLVRNVMIKYTVTAMDRVFSYNYNFVAAHTEAGLYFRMNDAASAQPQGVAGIKFTDHHAKTVYRAKVPAQWLITTY